MVSYVEVTGFDKEKVDVYFDSLLVDLAAKGNSLARDRLPSNSKVSLQSDVSPRFVLRNKKKVRANTSRKKGRKKNDINLSSVHVHGVDVLDVGVDVHSDLEFPSLPKNACVNAPLNVVEMEVVHGGGESRGVGGEREVVEIIGSKGGGEREVHGGDGESRESERGSRGVGERREEVVVGGGDATAAHGGGGSLAVGGGDGVELVEPREMRDEVRGDECRRGGDMETINGNPLNPSFPILAPIQISNSNQEREEWVLDGGLDVGLVGKNVHGPIGPKISGPTYGTPDLNANGLSGSTLGPNGARPCGPRVGPNGPKHDGPRAPIGPRVDVGLATFLDVLSGKSKGMVNGPKEGNDLPKGGPSERVSFASLMKQAHGLEDTRLKYTPPTLLDDGSKVVELSVDMVERGSKLYVNQLYGYFIGTSMDFWAVQAGVRRLWKKYDFESMGKNTAGFYFFKFKSEEGMLSVLRDGPWLVDQVPLFLHQWEPGLTLTKVEPKKVQIWIAIHDMSPDLWTGECVGALASRIGRPCFMDKPTTERCVRQTGRINYARVLVDIDAKDEVPSEIQVRYPPIRGREGFVKCLRVSYQWKPKRCSICEVFGHSTSACKHNPDMPTDQTKEDDTHSKGATTTRVDEEGFIKVGKKDKGKEKVVTSMRQEYRVRHDPRAPPKVTPPMAPTKDPTPRSSPVQTTPKGATPTTHHSPPRDCTLNRAPPKVTPPTAPSKDPTPPRPPKATFPKSSTHPTLPSPPRDCTVNSHNRFEILSDDEEDVENVYMEDGDVYPDDSGTAKFMELEDRYA